MAQKKKRPAAVTIIGLVVLVAALLNLGAAAEAIGVRDAFPAVEKLHVSGLAVNFYLGLNWLGMNLSGSYWLQFELFRWMTFGLTILFIVSSAGLLFREDWSRSWLLGTFAGSLAANATLFFLTLDVTSIAALFILPRFLNTHEVDEWFDRRSGRVNPAESTAAAVEKDPADGPTG